jgi:hypothetical protein
MKPSSLLSPVTALTAVNLVLLVFLLARAHPADAHDGAPPVLRGSGLSIVDAQGRVRASIMMQPEDRAHPLPDGSPRPENVILRLIDSHGRPIVKLGGSDIGSGLGLIGAVDTSHIVLQAEGSELFLKLATKDRQQLIKP